VRPRFTLGNSIQLRFGARRWHEAALTVFTHRSGRVRVPSSVFRPDPGWRLAPVRCFARILRWLVLACVGSSAIQVHAQETIKPLDAYFRETWTTRDGLPHNLVHAIVQTPDGYLWFATWEGLARYNGREFRVFDRGSVPVLRDNGIRALRPGRDGSLWLGTSRGGVSHLQDGRWRTMTRAEGLAQDEIMDLLEDREGRLWVGTESAGVTRVDQSGATHFGREAGLPSEVMYALAEDGAGAIWAATADGLARLEGSRFIALDAQSGLPPGQIFSLAAGRAGELFVGTEVGVYVRRGQRFELLSPELPRDNVSRMLRDTEGSLWVGTVNGGLYRYSARGVEQLSSLRGLPNDRVSALFQDREGSLWIGTNAGLLRLRNAPFTTFTTEHGLPDDYVRSVIADAKGRVWVGTSRGLGRYENGRFDALTRDDGLPGDSILSLANGADGSLWIGTYSNGVVRWKDGIQEIVGAEARLVGNQIRALLETRDGRLWVGTTRGLARYDGTTLHNLTVADGLPRDFIISLHEDRAGRLWVGTANGLAQVEGDRATAISLVAMDDAQDVFGFHETSDGTLWLATDRGIVRMRAGELRLVGRRQGLPVDTIFQIVEDADRHFWLTSNRGILRASRDDLEAVADGRRTHAAFAVYGESDGLASAQNNGGSGPVAWRTGDGRLWFGTAKGLATVDPATISEFVRQSPPVVIEEVRVDDRSMPVIGPLTLPAGTRTVELHFAGLSYLMPQKMRYRYRLDGFDESWVERGTMRFVQFTNLAPGDYRFRVVAANPEGEWGAEEATLSFRIEPRLMQRREFWFLVALIVVIGLYGLFRWRLYSLEHAQRRLRMLVERSTADLRAKTERLTAADQEKTTLLERLREQSEAFERQAREDSLTGLANRRSFDETLTREFARAARTGAPLAVALCDLDHFKALNDGYSHAAGDAALRAVADLIRQCCRVSDVPARWGGEEFALLFPDTTREEAHQICERLRHAVERADCRPFAPGHRLSISVGVTDRVGLGHHERLISRADAKLYEAKNAGRNRVCS
jgi:diguanylate cyclase (GGDEF)-like protein